MVDCKARRSRHTNAPRKLPGFGRQRVFGGIEIINDAPTARVEEIAIFGKVQTARCPLDQCRAEAEFKVFESPTDR